jgi:ComEC/Rec2-related protein
MNRHFGGNIMMKRPFLVIGAGFFFAVWLGFVSPGGSALAMSGAAAVTALLCLAARRMINGERLRNWLYTAAAGLLACAIGFGSYAVHAARNITPLLALEGRTAAMDVFVSEVDRGSATSYTVKAAFPEYPGLPRGVSVILRRAGNYEGLAGDRLTLTATLQAAPDTLWYRSRGIRLIANNAKDVRLLAGDAFWFDRQMISLREYLTRNIYAKLPPETAGLVSAMTFGLGGVIPEEMYAATSRAGTTHMLSVSGLHVSVFAGCAAVLLSRLGAKKKTGAFINIGLCFLFCAAAGFGAATTRAFIMTSITLVGRAFSRRSDALNSLGTALLFCGVFRPEWTLGWGLWISAGATAGIILFADQITSAVYEKLRTGRKALDRAAKYAAVAIGVSLAANALTFPVLLLMSGWVSLVSPLANMLVAPFVPITIFGGMLCAAIPGVSAPVMLAAWITEYSARIIVAVSRVFSELPFAVLAADENWIVIWVLAVSCLIAAVIVRGKAFARHAALLAVIGFSAGGLLHGLFYGDTIEHVALQDRNASVVLRGGDAVVLGTPDRYEITNLVRYIGFRGVKRIRAIIAPDCGDNVGGSFKRLAEEFGVDCILAPDDAFIMEALREASPESQVLPYPNAELNALGVTFAIDGEGKIILPGRTSPLLTPLGTQLFGEARARITRV